MPKFSYITSKERLFGVYEHLKGERYLFFDTEVSGDKIRLAQVGGKEDIFILDLFELGQEGVLFLKKLLSERGIVGHNLKFDLKYLYAYGIEPYAVFDTMIASQLLGNTDKHSLQKVAMHYLGQVLDKGLQASNWGQPFLGKEQLEYAALDVKVVRDLFYLFLEKLNEQTHREEILLKTRTSKVFGLTNPVAIVEMAFVQETAKLEMVGIPVDREELEKKLREQEKLLQKKVMDFMFRYRTDPMSPKQVGDLLTKRFGLDLPKTEKGNVSTDDKALAEYSLHPVVSELLEIRALKKTIEKLQEIKEKLKGNRVYPEFKQIGAITGRMASMNPNVQNIPRNLRSIFKAEEGKTFVIADFSQIELRIASEYVGEEKMIQAFIEGKDLHRYTASVFLGKPEDQITKEERQLAKAVNFGLIYGISAKGLVEYAKTYGVDLSLENAEKIRESFFGYYTTIRAWHERVKRELKEFKESRGYTLLGRPYIAHTFPDAVNYPIQGTGADLLKLSVLMFDAELRKENLKANVVNLVHDEVLVECEERIAERVKELLERAMKHAGKIVLKRVPAEVEVSINKRWEKD
ncbi:bifunctional 3'-5' exonuclease/DNA polymerase [Hydrogenobacter sp. T-2]|uniref:bifunctional 3'-5' exonuclease/DNA polymerase n=1 Tax=Pampinifervens diazotrophicum TaxID=1632018 RepID=UPI002B256CFF|nr:bifunctional 3'-5' exonuclease/DNA polymerase [Hydrogenobacter sp. T-2]WPM32613.1 bifunctional 3'-5' exonuclease/DNA polymerase [Hydrogenobacter sp. T-2]